MILGTTSKIREYAYYLSGYDPLPQDSDTKLSPEPDSLSKVQDESEQEYHIITDQEYMNKNENYILKKINKIFKIKDYLMYLSGFNVVLETDVSESVLVLESKSKEKIEIETKEASTCIYNELTFAKTAEIGDLDFMKMLLAKGCKWNERTFASAALNGDLNNMIWLFENDCPMDNNTFTAAAKNGNPVNLEWLFKNGCPMDEDTFTAAVLHGSLENIKFLKINGCPQNKIDIIAAAKKCDNLDNMKWFFTNGYPTIFTNNESYKDDFENVKWLL